MLSIWGIHDLHTSAQLVLAKRLGFFQEQGLDVQCKLFPSEEQFVSRFEETPQKPIVWSLTLPQLLRLRARGVALKILCPLAEISASYQLVLRDNAGIVLPGDLEGRKVGITAGSLIEIAVRNMANDFDLDVSHIYFVNASPVKQLELFANAEIDALACWEPWTSQACYMGGTRYFSGLYSHIPGHEGPVNWLTGQSMLVMLEEYIHSMPDPLIAILKAIQKATTYLHTTIHKAASVFSDFLETEQNDLVTLLQKNIYTMKMDALFEIGLISTIRLLSSSAPLCSSQEAVPPDALSLSSVHDLYESSLLAQIDPSLVVQGQGLQSQQAFEIIAEENIYYPAHAQITFSGSPPLRYIIVDDSPIVIEMMAEVIGMLEGQVVGTASTGAAAMVLYIDLLPDIVVIDISMPDMNGIDAIRSILRIHKDANIIVISGNNYDEIRREVFQLGVKLFIGKPFHIEHILAVLKKLLLHKNIPRE